MSTSDREPDDRPGSPEAHTQIGQHTEHDQNAGHHHEHAEQDHGGRDDGESINAERANAESTDPGQRPEEESTAAPTAKWPPDAGSSESAAAPPDPEQLSAIPEEGTPAPPDPARAFGSRPSGRPTQRIHPSGVAPGQRAQSGRGGHDGPAGDEGRSPQAGQGAGNRNPYDPRAPLPGDQEEEQKHSRPGVLGSLLGGNRDQSRDQRGSGGGGFGGTGPTEGAGEPGKGSDEQHRKLYSRGRLALVLGLAAVISSVFFPVGLLFGVPAIILGVKARRAGRSAGAVVPGAVPAIVLGVVSSVFAALMLVGVGMLWDEVYTWQTCQSGANTKVAEERCMNTFMDQVERRFPQLQTP